MVGGACLRALGYQKMGAWINLGGYTVVAIPLGLYLCFQQGLGMVGLWMGLAIGLTLVCTLFYAVLLCGGVDWEMAAEDASRSQSDGQRDSK